LTDPVCIIVVNWNGWRNTLECLESLFRLDYGNYEIVVCDNGSTDNSLARIRAWAAGEEACIEPENAELAHLSRPDIAKPIKLIEAPLGASTPKTSGGSQPFVRLISIAENRGFSSGVNAGLHYALGIRRFSYFWILNNDTVVEPNALTESVARLRQKQDAGMCGSTVLFYQNPDQVHAFGGARYFAPIGLAMHIGRVNGRRREIKPDPIERQMAYVMGASMVVTRKFVETVGLMNEALFLYYEELDWALRGKQQFSLAYAPKSVVYHKAGASAGSSRKSAFRSPKSEYFLMRNKLWITRRHYHFWVPFVLASLLFIWVFRWINGNRELAVAVEKALHHGLATFDESHK
jgi:GT2 family glycosyltransferase